MAEKRDTTQLNEDAKEAFYGTGETAPKTLKDAEGVDEVNEAADAEFNKTDRKPGIGNTVGGLRGASD